LQLALLEPEPEQEPNNSSYQGIVLDSIKLVERLVETNRTDPNLQDMQAKAQSKQEETWQLKDKLLLRYNKLYVLDCMFTN
jgi:hypothetical protein